MPAARRASARSSADKLACEILGLARVELGLIERLGAFVAGVVLRAGRLGVVDAETRERSLDPFSLACEQLPGVVLIHSDTLSRPGGSPQDELRRQRDRRLRSRGQEAEALLQIQMDGLGVVVVVADRQVLSGLEPEVAAAQARRRQRRSRREPRPPGRRESCAGDRAAGNRRARRSRRRRVLLAAERQRVRAADPGLQQQLDRRGDRARVRLGLRAERLRRMRRRLGDADDADVAPSVEDGDVLGHRDAMSCLVERAEVDVGTASVVVAELGRAESRSPLAARRAA